MSLDKYLDTDSPMKIPSGNPLDKYLPQERKIPYQEALQDISGRLFEAMRPKFSPTAGIQNEELAPIDLITGMAPRKISRQMTAGIKDVMLPEGIKEGIPRIALDIATDPETYVPGAMFAPKAVSKIAQAGRSGLGISSKSIKWLKQRGSKQIFTPEKESIDYIKTYLAPTVQKDVEQATTGAIKKAEQLFSKAESKLKAPNITLDKTFNNARTILDNYGMLDAQGRVLPAIKDKEIPRALKVIAEMYSEALPATGKISGVGPTVNKGFFKFYRQMLRDTQGTAGAFKRDVQHVIEGLYDDMEKAGAVGIRKAKDLFRKASQFEEEFGMTANQVKSKLTQATDPKSTVDIYRQLKPILGKKADAIIKNIKDHLVAQEFQRGKNIAPSRTTTMLRGARQAMKEYYEKGFPLPKP